MHSNPINGVRSQLHVYPLKVEGVMAEREVICVVIMFGILSHHLGVGHMGVFMKIH